MGREQDLSLIVSLAKRKLIDLNTVGARLADTATVESLIVPDCHVPQKLANDERAFRILTASVLFLPVPELIRKQIGVAQEKLQAHGFAG